MTNDALTAALAQVGGWTPRDGTWEFSDFRPENGRMPIEMAEIVATILNAVASGELVPAADGHGLVEALKACVASIEHADMADGVCCCGDNMNCHAEPMACGHVPVDAGDYYAAQAVQAARAALATRENHK